MFIGFAITVDYHHRGTGAIDKTYVASLGLMIRSGSVSCINLHQFLHVGGLLSRGQLSVKMSTVISSCVTRNAICDGNSYGLNVVMSFVTFWDCYVRGMRWMLHIIWLKNC